MTYDEGESREVVLVTRPAPVGPPHPLDTLREVIATSMGAASYTAATVVSLVEQTVTYAVSTSVNAALDRLVPAIADAIIERIDLTDVVIEQVDLHRIVTAALDSLDLTSIVLDRVDINAIVAEADVDAVIDRVPIVPLAGYVIDEIDLPQIIRDSTSGIAGEAMDTFRKQGVGADQLVSRLADRILLRRRERKLDAPGEPESLKERMAADLRDHPDDQAERDRSGGPAQPGEPDQPGAQAREDAP
jgi:hypothetical protein